MFKYKLTIAILTMNRADQMKHAVESCLNASLPAKTQFVIVDNASSDQTYEIVEILKNKCNYDLIYKRLPENRGVGGGRNVCFDLAEGEYFYILDDDAEIAEECRESFFLRAVDYLDRNQDVMTLTTHIVDKVYGIREPIIAKNMKVDELPCVYLFQGGSTFLRKKHFSSPLFLNIMYGHEEVPISMYVLDDGFYNVYMKEIYINHLPMVDKWKKDKDNINVNGISNLYVLKAMLYPSIFRFILWISFCLRLKKYGISDKDILHGQKLIRQKFMRDNSLSKIRFTTVIKAFKEFGITVF